MILRNESYAQLAEKIKRTEKKVIIYGAGMIGQTVVPALSQKYNISKNIECFIDVDLHKAGQFINAGKWSYEIKSPDYLYSNRHKGKILLITNSNFFSVLRFLDEIRELSCTEGYIVPLMQVTELRQQTSSVTIEKYTEQPLIPKKIHYCWFGKGKIPPFLQKCIESWKIYCPDYEIICWNEENFDIGKYAYIQQAYTQKCYSFVSDLARLDILFEHGGIYLDTDVTLIKCLDDLLYQEGFVGTEKWGNINTGGGCGFVPRHPMLKEIIDLKRLYPFRQKDGSLSTETNGLSETKAFLRHNFIPDLSLQRINGITVYPPYVFHPYDYMSGEIQQKAATYSIHHFYGNWMENVEKELREKTKYLYNQIMQRIKDEETVIL